MNTKLEELLKKERDFPAGTIITLFAKNLKYLRGKLTQQQIADKLHLPVSTYANWEQGRREPSIADIYNLMLALDATPNDLFPLD